MVVEVEIPQGGRGRQGISGGTVVKITVTAAGDIADPWHASDATQATADLVKSIDPTVALTLGDNQYEGGRIQQFHSRHWWQDAGWMASSAPPDPWNIPPRNTNYSGSRHKGPWGQRRSDDPILCRTV
jgi:hypothetical protein